MSYAFRHILVGRIRHSLRHRNNDAKRCPSKKKHYKQLRRSQYDDVVTLLALFKHAKGHQPFCFPANALSETEPVCRLPAIGKLRQCLWPHIPKFQSMCANGDIVSAYRYLRNWVSAISNWSV